MADPNKQFQFFSNNTNKPTFGSPQPPQPRNPNL